MGDEYRAKAHYQGAEVAESYDDVRFRTWHGRLSHQIERRALESVLDRHFEAGGKVLDLPCGTGRLLDVYSGRQLQVTGGDISENMLEIARRRFAGDSHFSFEKCDAESLPFPADTFDYLVSFRLMCHLPPAVRAAVLNEMLRVTRSILAVNYHFHVNSPLLLLNRLCRPSVCSPYPLRERAFVHEIERLDVELCEVRKLSWYERSSALVVIRKRSLA